MKKKIFSVGFSLCLIATILCSAVDSYAKISTKENLTKEQILPITKALEKKDADELLAAGAQIGNKVEENNKSLAVVVDEVKPAGEDKESRAVLPKAPRVANSFGWDYTTVPFDPAATRATSDIDIIWNQYVNGGFLPQYDILGTGVGSLPAKKLTGTTQAAYLNAVNEGRVNDYLGYHMPHQYYTTVANGEAITIMNSSKVRTAVYTASGQLCLDTGYNTNGNSLSPQAFVPTTFYQQTSATVFGSAKSIFYLTVPAGNYYIMQLPYGLSMPTQSNVDTLDNTYHYAFYVGKALPKLQRLSSYLNLGTVNPYISQTLMSQIFLNADDIIAPLYAIKKVRVDNVSFKHEYNIDTDYRYFSPNQTYGNDSSFAQYFMSDPLFMTPGYLEDATPAPGSMIGTWNFYFRHTIGSRPTFSQSGTLNIEYFTPFGTSI